MNKINKIEAREIKDSRGNPTVEVKLETDRGFFVASVPSGASTGSGEALELRDADGSPLTNLGGETQETKFGLQQNPRLVRGKGVSKAIENVNKIIAPKLKGMNPVEQKQLDKIMIDLDGTKNKSNLGANAILAVSLAICRAGAGSKKMPLYKYVTGLAGMAAPKIPFPMFNILEGGSHADNDLDIQEFMAVPQKKSFAENLVLGTKIFNNLKESLEKNFAGSDFAMGDEGGLAPEISKTEQALYFLKNVIGSEEVRIAIDCAASQFYKDGKYFLDGKEMNRSELLDFYQNLVNTFSIISIEDPFAEDDWQGFEDIVLQMGSGVVVVADDLTTTNIKKIKEAHSKNACNGVILKLNQIGTVSETIEASKMAKEFGWKTIVSHRSGETMDNFIADFSVGINADFIKAGAYTKEERMVKYNRLLEIENELK